MTGPINELLGTVGPHPSFAPAGPVRFSVVVRTQGTRPNSLREALESLANQTHQAHQVLVMVHTDDDRSSALGAVLFYTGLKQQGIASELHVYGNGGHGYGLRPVAKSQIATWPDHAAHWLATQGFADETPK